VPIVHASSALPKSWITPEVDVGAERAIKPQLSETLRESEEQYRLLVEEVRDYAIFLLDLNGNVQTWNAGAERLKGYTKDEIVGHHFSEFYPAEDVANGKPAWELSVAREQGRVVDTGWRIRKDGSRFWANVVITQVHDRSGRPMGFAKLTRDMTEQKRTEALEESTRQLNHFLAILAHELRNPLAPIRNAVNVLQASDLKDSALKWSSDVIARQVSHLTRLVDDLLDISRITRGKITLHREPIELSLVLVRAVESSQPIIDARRHRLVITQPQEPLWVDGDLTRLSQVVMNLLNNAAKFTQEEGIISLTTRSTGEWLEISVSDTGMGIPASHLDAVFNMFAQGDHALENRDSGLGIGLALVKQIVEMHGGTVSVASEGLGKGSTFTVRLRRLDRSQVTSRSAAGSSGSQENRPGLNILIVDDNRDAAESMATLLRIWGHVVRVRYDGPGGLAAAEEWHPEMVLLDIGLPGMDGHEVARRLRAIDALADTEIVAVTGFGRDEDVEKTRQAGFTHHLVKPVEGGVLKEMLASLSQRLHPNGHVGAHEQNAPKEV
jgi:PAS domain S-box-containing protein